MDIHAVKTVPYLDQVTGTSGLRKKVSVFKQENYLENFIQSIFDVLEGFEGKTLVLGGDGRYFSPKAVQSILRIAVANQFGRIVVGQNGILSTPAASHLIVKKQAVGGIILSASHNPGGPDGDFGVKFDVETGGGAPETLTQKIVERTRSIDRYWMADMPDVDLSETGEQTFGNTVVEVVDSVADYVDYMQRIFDFDLIKGLFAGGFRMRFDAMNAVTGPYAHRIFEELLGAPVGTVVNGTPLPDFGGLHPEPNLKYAKPLVDYMYSDEAADFGAASDGDGDRYMVLGKSFFVTPSDSMAVMLQYMNDIAFYKGHVTGAARSMPTAFAVDEVCRDLGLPVYATPTGWKFFGSLLEAGKIALCGEESFGAGSFHLNEKDGIWAVLFWLQMMAMTGKTAQELVEAMWTKYGRIFAAAHNFENIEKAQGDALMADLEERLPSLVGQTFGAYTVQKAYRFDYVDPVTGDEAKAQGLCVEFDNARVVVRLSGTGSVGATVRMYLNERTTDVNRIHVDAQTALADLIAVGMEIARTKHFTGMDKANAIT